MTEVVCTDPDMEYTMHRTHKVCDSEANARCQLQHLNNENAMMGSSKGGEHLQPAVANVQGDLMFKIQKCVHWN